MIREPTVGMRVRWITDKSFVRHMGYVGCKRPEINVGDTGTIKRLDCDGHHMIKMDKVDDFNFTAMEALTEIKENDMKKGDLVTITDWSYIVRVDRFEGQWSHDTNKHEIWEVIELRDNDLRTNHSKSTVHDIVIQSKPTGKKYLHSSGMVTLVKPKVKEVSAEQMMRDLKEKYGCEVKVTE